MPLYEYVCRSCAERFERMRKMEERLSAPECPACGARETVLSMSAPAHVGVGAGHASSGPLPSCDAGGGCCGGACMH